MCDLVMESSLPYVDQRFINGTEQSETSSADTLRSDSLSLCHLRLFQTSFGLKTIKIKCHVAGAISLRLLENPSDPHFFRAIYTFIQNNPITPVPVPEEVSSNLQGCGRIFIKADGSDFQKGRWIRQGSPGKWG